MKVIRVLGLAGRETLDAKVWIKAYEDTPDGRGRLVFTTVPEQALKFPDAAAAHNFWLQRSELVPTRPDGKPNRPLTAYTVDIHNEEEEKSDEHE